MKVEKVASIPLVLHDPYFSIWSSSDKLYDSDTVHWSGSRQQIRGYVTIDGAVYSFLGDKEFHKVIPQKAVDVTATSTKYFFENEKISMTVCFTSPLLLDDFMLVSRPCTYVDFRVDKKVECEVEIDFQVSSDLVQRKKDKLIGSSNFKPETEKSLAYQYAVMGRAFQQPLGNSGDHMTIDWGYVYLASKDEGATLAFDKENGKISCHLTVGASQENGVILAYDDLLSINYFGEWKKAYWTEVYSDILEAIGSAFKDKEEVLDRAQHLDEDVYQKALASGGEDYAFLCTMSYRHVIAAHKLIKDENGEIIFLSKENDSNGCIGTVDLSYPSSPLFLLYNTEYMKGMLRPVYKFAECDVWEYDFAPHDVGRYPYAWGQVYGLNGKEEEIGFSGENGAIFPPYYMYPKESNVFDLKYQMPVEESGNMLILTAAVCMLDGDVSFAKPYMETLKKWTEYLIEYGGDPGEQLCTDDFAGHLSHNVNLSAKAIMGIQAFSQLEEMSGNKELAAKYHKIAETMAKDWEKRANAGDHYMLAFGKEESWSLKYNLIWDKFFESNLFSREVYDKELDYYIKKRNTYGTPLDNRRDYTKSDWVLWCTAMTEQMEKRKQLISPVADYLRNTTTRVPFSDWYETVTGEYCHFIARSVQGGIYMPMLMDTKKL